MFVCQNRSYQFGFCDNTAHCVKPKYRPRFIHVSEVISPFFSAALFYTYPHWVGNFFLFKNHVFNATLGSGINVDLFLDCFPWAIEKGYIYWFLTFFILGLLLLKGATFIQRAMFIFFAKYSRSYINSTPYV